MLNEELQPISRRPLTMSVTYGVPKKTVSCPSAPVNIDLPGVHQKISRGLKLTVVRIVTGLLERQFGNA